ncbi:MAG TPA: S8 family serine peptidase [Pyrinomonadaceae bacterium]|nr:S8 family serine peptidase [Pyrinomonadaceae bacterium]
MKFSRRLRAVTAWALAATTILCAASPAVTRAGDSLSPRQHALPAGHDARQNGQGSGAWKRELFGGREVVAGQVLVKFRDSASAESVARAEQGAGAELVRKVGGAGARLLHSRGKDTAALVQEFSERDDVLYAEPNFVIRPSSLPNDTYFSELWGLRNTGYTSGAGPGTQGADIAAEPAWDVSTGSRDVVVAVVDTGVDYNHPDLTANMWSAPAPFTVQIGGQTIRCEAGTHGFNAITRTCDPMDDHSHGTHVAGTIGAGGNNGVGVVGVNQTASMMGLKFLAADGSGTLADALDALDFAIQAKQAFAAIGGANVRVLSNSWGWSGQPSQALLDQINRAGENDMLFVAGAGNEGSDNNVVPFYPASYDAPNVVSVAATDNRDALAYFSNYGAGRVHLAAPGVFILSTIVGGSYDWFSGTSMATPHVSGAAALVLSRCPLGTAALKDNLLGNVDQVPSLSGVTTTGGRLNVSEALLACADRGPLSSLTLSAASVTGTKSSVGTVTLAAPAPSTGATVYLSSSNTAAATVPSYVKVAAGATSKIFTVATKSVSAPTKVEVTATYQSHARRAELVVAPPVLNGLSLSPSTVTGLCQSSALSVTLNAKAPAGGVLINLTNDNPAASVPGSVTIPAGATSATITVTASPVGAKTVGSVTARPADANFGTTAHSRTLTVMPNGVKNLVMDAPANTVTGPATVLMTMTLACPAPAGGQLVLLSTSRAAVARPVGSDGNPINSVAVGAGQTQATFRVQAYDVAAPTSATINATANGITKSLALKVN